MPQRAAWASTYRLSSAARQQRVLRAIQRLGDPGIKALGATQDSDSLIVIECSSAATEIMSRQIVMAVDLQAVRTETTRAAGRDPNDGSAEAAYVAGLRVLRRLI